MTVARAAFAPDFSPLKWRLVTSSSFAAFPAQFAAFALLTSSALSSLDAFSFAAFVGRHDTSSNVRW